MNLPPGQQSLFIFFSAKTACSAVKYIISGFFGKGYKMPAKVDKEKCTGCETCVSECPSEAIAMDDGKAQITPETCIDCGVCIDSCPESAIGME